MCQCGFGSPGSGGGGTSFADPSAEIGLTVVNGSATTAMRSDAAPPLDQGINPIWTGLHTFDQLAGAGVRMVITDTAGVLGSAALPSAPPAPANPSASIGLAAVNGAASTYMRSDAAPALDQSIAPTWLGLHVFTLTSTSTKNMGGFGGPAAAWVSSSAIASYGWVGTGGAANEKNWTAYSNGGGWILAAVDDANAVANPAISITRSGTALPSMAWGDATTLHNYAGSIQVSKKLQKLVHALAIAASLVAVDAAAGDIFSIAMSANATLSNPTNPPPAGYYQVITIRARQTAGGSHTLAYDTAYRFPGGVAPVLSTADGTVDYLAFAWNETDSKWDYVGQALNFL